MTAFGAKCVKFADYSHRKNVAHAGSLIFGKYGLWGTFAIFAFCVRLRSTVSELLVWKCCDRLSHGYLVVFERTLNTSYRIYTKCHKPAAIIVEWHRVPPRRGPLRPLTSWTETIAFGNSMPLTNRKSSSAVVPESRLNTGRTYEYRPSVFASIIIFIRHINASRTHTMNKIFIDIRLCPGITTPLVVVG